MTVTGSSVGTKQGFSILTYTGTNSNESIPHGLDSAPSFYIVKARENSAYTDFWSVYHQSLGKDAYIKLNTTDAASTSSNIWNNTAQLIVYSMLRVIVLQTKMILIMWHICGTMFPDYKNLAEYTGNGNADGTFVELGFQASIVWVKRTDSTEQWI